MKWHRAKQNQKRWDHFKGTLLLCLTAFLTLSLFSYSPQDPSLNSFGLHLKVLNVCGYAGAILSDLFFQLFGLAGWLFVPAGIWSAVGFFKPNRGESFWISLSFYFLAFASFACLLNLYFPKALFYGEEISLGGALGTVPLKVLTPFFHTAGTTLILCSILIPAFVFSGWNMNKKPLTGFLIFSRRFLSLFRLTGQGLMFLLKNFPEKLTELKNKIQKIHLPKIPVRRPLKDLWESRREELSFEPEEEKTLPEKHEAEKPEKSKEEGAPNRPQESVVNQPQESVANDPSPPADPAPSSPHQTFTSDDLPPLDLLSAPVSSDCKMDRETAQKLSKKLTDKLQQFSISGRVTAIKTGPAVTLFEFRPEDNVKISKIREMGNDISLALSSESVRIIAPIPGRDVVGIEVSNSQREMVYLKTLLEQSEFSQKSLPLILGRRADNAGAIEDLARIPHLLIAGTTGSGKSQFVISFITGLLFRHTPETLRLILIDPKQVDLSSFKGVPHLLSPPIVSPAETLSALRWAISEMEKRYRSLARFGVRDCNSFNKIAGKLTQREIREHEEWNKAHPDMEYYYEKLPLICLVIEEFGDLMADPQFKKSVEMCVVRLAQKARAGGIHLILAMQSPRKDVITGLIKTNIPGRISFKVSSGTDSRVILDETGAERLLSHGDMLFLQPGTSKPLRFHGPFIDEEDVKRVVTHWKERGEPKYILDFQEQSKSSGSVDDFSDSGETDPMFDDILSYVKTCSSISASFLQRKFRIGYPRAARLIEILYEKGVIGPPQGSKPREVLDKELS